MVHEGTIRVPCLFQSKPDQSFLLLLLRTILLHYSAVQILVEIVEQYMKRGIDVCFVKLRSGNEVWERPLCMAIAALILVKMAFLAKL